MPSLLLSLLLASAAPAQHAALFDELTPLFSDTAASEGAARLAADTPRGVPAGAHVLVSGLAPDAELHCAVTLDGQPVAELRLFQLIDVPVEQNTGLDSRTEAWDKKTNPHVIRRAPFRVFEALAPIDSTLRADSRGVAALRVEIPVDAGAEPAARTFTVTLASGAWRQELSWHLTVHSVTVPPSGAHSRGYTNWFSPGLIAQRHELEPWSEPFWDMLGRYADLMARGRQTTFWVPWANFARRAADGTITLDRERLERYVRLFLDRGFTRVEGGHLAGRHGGDWSSPRLDFTLTGEDVASEAGAASVATFLGLLAAALPALDLPPHVAYLQHLTDEPTDTNAEAYGALAAQVREKLPGVRIFEATMSQKLVGAVNAWCPQVQVYQRHRDFFEARRSAGDDVWVYTCLIPGGPWLNRLLDQERLRPLLLGWALEKYDLAGFLHWGLNHYRAGVDPLAQSVVPHGEGPPNFLPAGDSHVVYPGATGPLSGVRFEAQRIGMEDAELLRVLRLRSPARADEVISRVFRAFDDYEKDVTAYRAARRALLAALAEPLRPGSRVALFNGADLAGWTAFFPDGKQSDGTWRVQDGVLVCSGQPVGYLRTDVDYANFVLKLEWRWNPETKQTGNSGVLVRVIGADRVWPRCVEAQLQHENAGDFWNIGAYPMRTDPQRTRGANTRKLKLAERPAGEWNEYEIRLEGDRVTLVVNGEVLNEAWDVLEIPGKIAVQSEGTEIHFRNIVLRPLE